MKPRLVLLSGGVLGQIFALAAETTIGRDPHCALVLDDDLVSRRHAVIRKEGLRFRVEDAGSRHGTKLNGEPVTNAWLDDGDRLELGGVTLQFLILGEVPEAQQAASADVLPRVREMETAAASTIELAVRDALLLSSDRVASHPEGTRVARDLAALLAITTELGASPDVDGAASVLLERLADIVPAQRGGLCLLPRGQATLEEGEEFESVRTWERERGGAAVPLSRTIARKVIADRVGLLSNFVMETGEWEGAESLRAARVRSVLCVPLVVQGAALGVIYLDSSASGSAFDEAHLQFVAGVSVTAALALDTLRRVERLEAQNRRLVEDVSSRHGMIGSSPKMRELAERITKAAATDSTVLVRGESGTGKELVAHAIHAASKRAAGPFVAINCAAIPETLLESELFGHEKGAFTGAVAKKQGKVELADGGTLFLDEMGDLPMLLQAKLLRALQQRTFERVGGTQPVRVDVRIVAATHVDLEKAVKEGRFRQDLYYRLNVVTLTIPPLRERRDDVLPLARHFAEKLAAREGRRAPALSKAVEDRLVSWPWPGNVRELENAIERAIVLGSGDEIRLEDLPETLLESAPAGDSAAGASSTLDYHERLNDAKRQIVRDALAASGGVVTEAARRMDLNPTYLHRLMNNLGLRE